MSFPISRRVRAAAVIAALVAAPAAIAQNKANPIQKVGKYAVELRVPAEGVYAGEEVDIEFRLTDTSREDPVLGAPGVVRAKIVGSVAMPSMPAMPNAVPKIHAEGVPGDYGLVTTFPHGGAYRIALTITPPGDNKPFQVGFPLEVKDDDGKRKPTPKPFTLSVKTDPARPVAGRPVKMTILVHSRATGKPVTDFDIVHEQKMHLILVRDDLGAFFHEHPDLHADGRFTYTFTFPTGGNWRVFGDVAPQGAGSQITMAPLVVDGPKQPRAALAPVARPVVKDSGMVLSMKPMTLTARKTLPVMFTLNEDSGKPVTDLQPWLGAMAHLILIEQDAATFVHSHPDEADPRNGRNGTLTFLSRFPKPGIYKGWVQFQRGGTIHTMPFVVRATEGS